MKYKKYTIHKATLYILVVAEKNRVLPRVNETTAFNHLNKSR